MPYKIYTEEKGAKIVTKYFGLLTTADINESYRERLTDIEKIKKYRMLLSDFTDVTETDIHDLDIETIAELYKKAAHHNPDIIAVAIVPDEVLYSLGRVWEAYVGDIDWKEKIFHTKEEAHAFIAECSTS